MVESGQEFDPRPGDTEFWDDEVPLRMLEALSHSLERYDVIIVDEGQDFSLNWWPVVEELLFSRKSGELYIFYDPLQNIFNKDSQFPIDEVPFSLNRQCRNTRRISEFVAETAGVTIPSYHGQPEGDPVTLKSFESEGQLKGMLSQTIKDLVIGGVKPRSIAILCPLPLSESPMQDCSELCGFPIVESPLPRKSQSIRFSTIGRFKGLEAEIVIVVDARAQTAADKMRLYVAAT
jgi:DNA helicase IV